MKNNHRRCVLALLLSLAAPLPIQAQNSARFSGIGSGQGNTIQKGANYSYVGGGRSNRITANTVGSFIGGGVRNTVRSNYSALIGGQIGGGFGNTVGSAAGFIGSGVSNTVGQVAGATSAGLGSVIAGGYNNTNTGQVSFISGGMQNVNRANYATVGGGYSNVIESGGTGGTIGGGYFNKVTAPYGAVPGGYDNAASGSNSLAAGFGATAEHSGAFVWADMSTNSEFPSTAANQFLVRAAGGMGINTNNPGTNALSVNGTVQIGTIQVMTGASDPSPSLVASNGSIYINTAGGKTNTMWFRLNGNWYTAAGLLVP